jgi:fructoselysine 6-kinase
VKIIGIGDNVVDYYEYQGIMYPGGNALNVPVLCKRLGAEQASYIGILGTDQAGSHVLHALITENIDVSHVRQAIGPNAQATVTLREGERVFVGSTGGVQEQLSIRLNGDDIAFVNLHDLVHTSVYSHIEDELPNIPLDISFDFSTHRNIEYLDTVCPHISLAFFSGSDLEWEDCHALMQRVSDYGVNTVVVTRGSDGALCLCEGQMYTQAALPVEVLVDTLGAGDAFIAGFLTGLGRHQPVSESLNIGAQAAATTCLYYGAFGYPLEEEAK